MSMKEITNPKSKKSDSRPPTLWGMLTVMWRQVQREQTMTICFQIFRKCSKKIKKIIIFFFWIVLHEESKLIFDLLSGQLKLHIGVCCQVSIYI